MNKLTVVIGASENTERYSNKAVRMLQEYKIPVKAVGLKKGTIEQVTIEDGKPAFENVDTVTLYVGPQNQAAWYEYILSLKPRRIIFNPGTENEELENKLNSQGIEVIQACTLVMLRTRQF